MKDLTANFPSGQLAIWLLLMRNKLALAICKVSWYNYITRTNILFDTKILVHSWPSRAFFTIISSNNPHVEHNEHISDYQPFYVNGDYKYQRPMADVNNDHRDVFVSQTI